MPSSVATCLRDLAVAAAVGLRHVGKARPERIVVRARQRIRSLQVDVVGDQHQAAALELRLMPPAALVNTMDPTPSCRSTRTPYVDLCRRIAFVEMRAPGHHGHVQIAQLSRRRACRHGRRRWMRASPEFPRTEISRARSARRRTRPGRCRARPRCDGRSAGAALDVTLGFLRHSNIPAMQADMKFAIVPAATAFNPSRARSDLRVGASAPMPPI